MLLGHIGIASLRQRQFQCVPTTYVNSLNEFFHDKSFLTNFSTIFLGLSVMSM